jgi:hypothetical protein
VEELVDWDLRLREKVVEIYYNGKWMSLCDDNMGLNNSKVIC